jgi:hypothetical protein
VAEVFIVSRDSIVGIATRYGLHGPGIESLWGRGEIFRTRPDRLRPTPVAYPEIFFGGGGVQQI